MATHALTRRGFLGHVAGAYAATAVMSGTSTGFATMAPADLGELIASHETALAAWVDKISLDDDDETPEAQSLVAQLSKIEEDRLQALLRYRPRSIEEVWQRMQYLRSGYKWWVECMPFDEDVDTLVRSMMPVAQA